MKKIISITLALIMAMSLQICSYAADAGREVDVVITASAYCVNIGEKVTLTAAADKKGSSYTDEWEGAVNKGTGLDTSSDEYVSTAEFTAEKAGIYTVVYKIDMGSGNSGKEFTGTGSCTIEVAASVSVTGAEIRNLVIEQKLGSDGKLLGYTAIGNLYILWSDETSTLYSTMFFYFRPDEYTKDISVSFEVDGKWYTDTVTVKREA